MAETRRRIPLRTRPSSAIQGGQSNLNLRTCPGVQLDLRGRSGGQSDSSSDDEDALDKLEGDFRRQHLERYSKLQKSTALRITPDLPSIMSKPTGVLVTHVEDPMNVYIKLLDSETDLLKNFQAHCENSPQKKLQYNPLLDMETYAWKNMKENKWKRVRVVGLGRNPEDRLCLCFDIDSGSLHQVGYDELYHLCSKFAKISGQVYRAFLLDVLPINDSVTTGSMKELALGKKLLGVALTTKLPVSNEPLPLPWQYLFSYGIYLYENSSNSSLNAALCQHKIADSFGPMGGFPGFLDNDLSEKITQVENWSKPSEFTFAKLKEIFGSSGFRISKASTPVPSGNDPPKLSEPFRDPLSWKREKDKLTWDTIPKEIQGRLAVGLISAFISPGCFYIQMYDKMPIYNAMIKLLEQMLILSNKVPVDELKLGDFIVIRLPDIQGQEHSYRAIVKYITEGTVCNRIVHVLLIDFGYSVCIRSGTHQVQRLPEKFEKIVPFCYRVHLDTVRCTKPVIIHEKLSPADKWPWHVDATDCSKTFLGEVIISDQSFSEIKCFFWKPLNAAVCQLTELDQEVEYDTTNKTWVPISFERRNHNEKDKFLNSNRTNNILLAQLFVSIGIDFGVDELGQKNEPNNSLCSYTLKRVSCELIDKGIAVATNKLTVKNFK